MLTCHQRCSVAFTWIHIYNSMCTTTPNVEWLYIHYHSWLNDRIYIRSSAVLSLLHDRASCVMFLRNRLQLCMRLKAPPSGCALKVPLKWYFAQFDNNADWYAEIIHNFFFIWPLSCLICLSNIKIIFDWHFRKLSEIFFSELPLFIMLIVVNHV